MNTDGSGKTRSEVLEELPISAGMTVDPFPTIELRIAVATAIDNGEPLAVVAAAADVPSLAVLDALDAVRTL